MTMHSTHERLCFGLAMMLLTMAPVSAALAQDAQSTCANVNDAAQAIQACTGLLQNGGMYSSDTAKTYDNRAMAELNAKQYDAAVADAAASLQADPTDGNGYVIRGLAAYNQNQFQDAIAALTQGIAMHPSFSMLAYQMRGIAEENSGSPQAAIQDETSALQTSTSNELALFVRGEAEGDLNQNEAALQDDNAALALNPSDSKALVNRGNVYMHENQFQSAISDDTAAIAIDPSNETAFVNRSISEAEAGLNDQAIADDTQALHINPSNPAAYTVRGVAEGNEQNYTQEVADERAALQINPNLGMAQQSLTFAQQKLGQ